jgi:hypothetical protein
LALLKTSSGDPENGILKLHFDIIVLLMLIKTFAKMREVIV